MDPVTMTYYAAVYGMLGVGAGRVRSALTRLLLGVLVGVIAAAVLPMVRSRLGILATVGGH